MEEISEEQRLPAMRIGHAERDATIRGLERAMAEGHLTFAEMESRMGLVYRAKTADDLAAVTHDLPHLAAPPQPAATAQLGSTQFNMIGSIRRGGWIAVPHSMRAISLIGDVTIDLSSADIPTDGVEVTLGSLLGEVTVVVADGTPVDIATINLLGDRNESLSQAVDGMPPVRIRGFVLIGEFNVYSLSLVPEGRLRAWWASVRKRALGRGGTKPEGD